MEVRNGKTHEQAEALKFRAIQEGRLVMVQTRAVAVPKDQIRYIRTSHECPYCHDPLYRLDPRDGRYVGRAIRLVGSERVTYEPIPSDVIGLKCLPCDAHDCKRNLLVNRNVGVMLT